MKKILFLFALLALFTTNASAADGDVFVLPVGYMAPDGTPSSVSIRFKVVNEKYKYVSIIGEKDAEGNYHSCIIEEWKDYSGEIYLPSMVVNTSNDDGVVYTVRYIGEYAFYNCSAKITLPGSISIIDKCAFMDYQYDGYDFKLPSNVQRIGHAAFVRAKIKGISLNAGLSSIESSAFAESDIESLVIPATVTNIGTAITAGCNKLDYLAVTYTNETYYSDNNVVVETESKKVVAGCKSSVIPDDVKSIDHEVFWGTKLRNQTITIPESVTSIGSCAFESSNIKHLIIRSKTLDIGPQAFMYNYDMERLDFYGGDVTINRLAFQFCEALKEMWCHDHKPKLPESEHKQFEYVGPDWFPATHNGQTKIFAKYPDEFTDEVEGIGNVWEYWLYPHIYGLDENVIGSVYLDDYTWPLAGEDADFTATSLTEHATVSKVAYRKYSTGTGWIEFDPSPCALGGKFDIGFTINLDEGYAFADDAPLFVGGDQADLVVKRSDTERVYIIQDYTVPAPPGGVPITSVSVNVEEPVEGQPLSTKVTWPTSRAWLNLDWSLDSVVWTGGNPDSYDPTKSYTLTVYVHANTADYRFSPDIVAKLNDKTAGVKFGTNSEGISTLALSIHYGLQVYTVFDEDYSTLTYYYDNQFDSRSGAKEEYDPVNNPYAVRFKDYSDKVVKAVIDPSMKDAPLTSTSYMFCGGQDPKTKVWNYLTNMTEIEGLENLNTENVTTMENMFRDCSSLKSVNLSSFNTANVRYMENMFYSCESLTSLDLTNFNTDKVWSMSRMFYNCPSLTTIYCNERWYGDGTAMFLDCKALVGSKGTEYNENNTDQTYARPDGGEDKPGYFTRTAPTLIDYIGLELTPLMSELEKGDEMPFDFISPSWGTNLYDADFKPGSLQWYYAEKANKEGDGLMPVDYHEGYDPATHYVLMTSFRADEDYTFAEDIKVRIMFEYNDNKNPIFSNSYTDSQNRNVLLVMFDCPAKIVKGDVNGDGKVNTADVVAVYTYIEKGAAESGFTKEAADVNGDTNVNTADVVAIYSIIVKGDTE